MTGLLTAEDLHYFNEGRARRLFDRLGAQLTPHGVHFAVWAPNARAVSVIGDFNGWRQDRDVMTSHGSSGLWSVTVPQAKPGDIYKYHIRSHHRGLALDKADPFAFCAETPPRTGSVVWDLGYQWGDADWMRRRGARQRHDAPMAIYELHLDSWRRRVEDGNRPLSYSELAEELVAYVKRMGFTHVEFMPVMDHPYGGSWGYHVAGYYAPSRRYGDPQELMRLIDALHQADISVILDWVPSHFAVDAHSLARFDGTALYEHEDPRQGWHPDWGSYIFNYGRPEVRSFLISNALFWLEKYHADALRVDAVASMLYLDYSRQAGEWVPNDEGGHTNKDAVQFLQELNRAVYAEQPDAQMIAEESTAWSGVSRPVHQGGLGFGYKWDMGWMHDTLRYFKRDPVHRRYHQNDLTFRSCYAFSENFILPLSHDEVVHGKGSLLGRMPGDDWRKFANLRALYTLQYCLPGKKLLFMGGEFAQWAEWNHMQSLDWHLLTEVRHSGMQELVAALNRLYREQPALHADCQAEGFAWIDASDSGNSIVSFRRRHPASGEELVCVFNLTPTAHPHYRIGVPQSGNWTEIFNSNAARYGGSGDGNGIISTENTTFHGHASSLALRLPALCGVVLRRA